MFSFTLPSTSGLLTILFLLKVLFRVKTQCVTYAIQADTIERYCASTLNSTLYFRRPTAQFDALNRDLNEIHSKLDQQSECDETFEFLACYLLHLPCIDSLPRPVCMDDCIVAETIIRYTCVSEFQFILGLNNTLLYVVKQFDCQRPESYILGTTSYSTQCFPLAKLRRMFENDIIDYQTSSTVTNSNATVLLPDDGNVVAIVMSTLVGTACIVVFVSLLIWCGVKRRRRQLYNAALTQPIAGSHSSVDKYHVYDDLTTSSYSDVEYDYSITSSY